MSSVSRSPISTKTITSVAMLTGIAYVVMLFSKMLPSVNGFLDFDFKDVVICIGGFTYGPMAAAFGGGGHLRAAGCSLTAPSIREATERVLREIEAQRASVQ